MRVLLVFMVLVIGSFSTADAVRPWELSTGTIETYLPSAPTVIDRSMVEVTTRGVLDAESLDLVLPDARVETAVQSGVEHRGRDSGHWAGHIAGDPPGIVSLTVRGDDLVGSIWIGRMVYRISPSPNGGHVMELLDTSTFPGCAGAEPGGPGSVEMDSESLEGGSTVVIDVLAVYTPEARDDRGGTAGMQLWAQAAVDETNLAFSNSEMDARFRLVHAAEVDYHDTGNSSADLSWVASNSTVAALRNTFGADLVGLFVADLDACGRGYLPGSFQVTKNSCAVGNLTYAHEHGHNMGMAHNPEDSSVPPVRPYGYGHRYDGNYRTVMSYNCSSNCGRVPHFSNPNVDYSGLPTGIADARDNARAGDDEDSGVAANRPSLTLLWDGFETGDLGRWSLVAQ